MKKWPEDGKPASFSDIVTPIYDAIHFAYDLKRKNEDKDIPWTGLPKASKELVSTFPVDYAFSAEMLSDALEDQDRDALREILAVLVQLTFEQERRIALNDISTWLDIIEISSGSDKYTKHIRSYFHQGD